MLTIFMQYMTQDIDGVIEKQKETNAKYIEKEDFILSLPSEVTIFY